MLNRITMTGRLVADPELRRTQSGVSVTSFRIANDRDYQNGWPKITSGPGATRVIWCSLHLTRTAPWQK